MMTLSSALKHRLGHLKNRMLYQKEVCENDMKTELRRCLTTPQLTLLGIGNTIGVGIYVMLGVMAKETAGPSVVLSFVAAIFVTMMNALVYAEFATFVPQTGACYMYIYKVLGEFVAFLVGWVMLIMFALSSSVGARAWSGMLDSFFNHTIQEKTIEVFGKIQFGLPFAESLDILAFLFQIVVVVIISCNVMCSSIINTILGVITSSVLVFVFIIGLIYGDPSNFTNVDNGGFFPFGIAGVIKGASLAIYATSGFEIVSLSAEETKNPAKSIPRAIILELLIVGLVYIGAAIGMLFLIPYWLIDLRAPLPSAFEHSGVSWGKLIVTVGPMFGITNLQMLGMYSFSRVIYRMAKDGLFFQWFLKVNKRTGIPFNSVLFVGFVTSVSALLLDLSYVVKITVILMLLNFMVVGSALIKLKITECRKRKEVCKTSEKATAERQVLCERDFYNQEIVVSEYETCESRGSPEEEVGLLGGNIHASTDVLVSFDSDKANTARENEGKSKSEALEKLIAAKVELSSDDSKPSNYSLPEISEKEWKESESLSTGESSVLKPTKLNSFTDLNESNSDVDSDEQHTLFQKSSKACQQSQNKNNSSQNSIITSSPGRNTCKEKAACLLAPFVPGVISVNTLLMFHWITCLALSFQVCYGWQDLYMMKFLALLAFGVLAVLLGGFSVLLWTQCGSTNTNGFQTPLMPLVPTISIISSSVLMLSAGELVGFIEVAILLLVGAVVYIVVILVGFEVEPDVLDAEETEQRKALVGGSGDDADDEVDTEDEL